MRKTLVPLLIAGCLSAMTLTGCKVIQRWNQEAAAQKEIEEAKPKPYFAIIPSYSESGIAMVGGDFNKDENLDLIVGSYASSTRKARLYFFKGDGKGNFEQGEFSKPIDVSE